MLINLIKGEIKLVGVRPISRHYFNLYSDELKKIRVKFKPGFIPPYYVHMPKNFNEIMDSEMRYLKEFQKNPVKTDLKYLFLALKNVLLGKIRSG